MDLPSYDGVLCTQPTEETLEHIFFKCDFVQACWFRPRLVLGCKVLGVTSDITWGCRMGCSDTNKKQIIESVSKP
jgi:hypothetical protein